MPSAPGERCTVVAISSTTGVTGRPGGKVAMRRRSSPLAAARPPVIRPRAFAPGAPQNPTSRLVSSGFGGGGAGATAAGEAVTGTARARSLRCTPQALPPSPANAVVSRKRRLTLRMRDSFELPSAPAAERGSEASKGNTRGDLLANPVGDDHRIVPEPVSNPAHRPGETAIFGLCQRKAPSPDPVGPH